MLNILLALVSVANANLTIVRPHAATTLASSAFTTAAIDTIYRQDFENGLGGWTTEDMTGHAYRGWHIDAFQAYGGSGKSWWMGDPAVFNGYLDHWYVMLDSPSITVPGTGTPLLTFMQNRALEGLTGGYPSGYDGWDGVNVRVSTDNGANWTVIEPVAPKYNSTSMFSFGFEQGEGPGIPGWGGSSGGWIPDTFDLSAYKGQTIKIRWAMASDPAYCTIDNHGLFGWQIDDIKVGTVFSNSGDDSTGFSAKAMGGQLWHLSTPPDAPTPTHVADCSNNQGTYERGMKNFITSPWVQFRADDSLMVGVDFMLRGGFKDQDTFPYVDIMYVQLQPEGDTLWYYFSNPTGDTTMTNIVFTVDTTDIGGYGSFNTIFSGPGFFYSFPYPGKKVRFRIGLQSDADAPQGIGIKFDHFVVYSERTGVTERSNPTTAPFMLSTGPTYLPAGRAIRYELPAAGHAKLTVYSTTGAALRTLVDGRQTAGGHSVAWDGRAENGLRLAAGTYFIRLDFEGRQQTRKLIVVR